MNKIFKEDPNCQNRSLYIKTFSVVPVTNRLGIFEWVDDTQPLRALINEEHKKHENNKDLNESRAVLERRKWLKKLPGNAKKENLAE